MSGAQTDESGEEPAAAADLMGSIATGFGEAWMAGLELMSGLAESVTNTLSNAVPQAGAAQDLTAVGPAMAEAAVIALSSWARYAQGLADIAVRRREALQHAVYSAMPGRTAEPDRAAMLVDELRACLREVGETAMREARQLERDMSLLSEKLARSEAPASETDPYRRAWKVKP